MPYHASNNIAELLMQQGQIEGRREQARGQAYGQMGAQLGQIASNTIGEVMKYKADEPRRQMEKMQYDEAQHQEAGKKFTRDFVTTYTDPTTGIVDHDAVKNALIGNGLSDFAQTYGDTVEARYDKTLNGALASIERQGDVAAKLIRIGQLAEKNPAMYKTELRGQAVKYADMVGIPETAVPLEYDPEQFPQLMQGLQTRADEFQAHARQLRLVEAARKETTDTIKADQFFQGAANDAFSRTTDQASYDRARANLASVGVPQSAREQYGPVWSAEIKQQALEAQLSPDKVAELAEKRTQGLQGFLSTARAEAAAAGKPFGSQEILINTTAYESAGKGDSFDRTLARIYPKGASKDETLAFRRAWEQAGHFNDSAAALAASGDLKFRDSLAKKNAELKAAGKDPLDAEGEIAFRKTFNLSSGHTDLDQADLNRRTAAERAERNRRYRAYTTAQTKANASGLDAPTPILKQPEWEAQEYGDVVTPEPEPKVPPPGVPPPAGPPPGDLSTVARPGADPWAGAMRPGPPAAAASVLPAPPPSGTSDPWAGAMRPPSGTLARPEPPVMPPPPAPPPASVNLPAPIRARVAEIMQQKVPEMQGRLPNATQLDVFVSSPKNREFLRQMGVPLPEPSAPVAPPPPVPRPAPGAPPPTLRGSRVWSGLPPLPPEPPPPPPPSRDAMRRGFGPVRR